MGEWNDGFEGPRGGEFGNFHQILALDVVPRGHAPSWMEIAQFALTFDGYAVMGERLGEIANLAAERWRQTGQLPESLVELRAYLFFEQRRWRHLGTTPTGDELDYIKR